MVAVSYFVVLIVLACLVFRSCVRTEKEEIEYWTQVHKNNQEKIARDQAE